MSQHKEYSMEEVFELLLKAREGTFDPSIPFRPTASPINRSVDCFYVVPNSSKRNVAGEELRVKYNNVIRSKIWWSPEHNSCLGIVSRAMSMKTRSESTDMRRSYEHGFQGHWVSLLERPSASNVKDKALIRTYVQGNAPSFVQFWTAQPKPAKLKGKGKANGPTFFSESAHDEDGEDESGDFSNPTGVEPFEDHDAHEKDPGHFDEVVKEEEVLFVVNEEEELVNLKPVSLSFPSSNSIGSQMNVVEGMMDGIRLDGYMRSEEISKDSFVYSVFSPLDDVSEDFDPVPSYRPPSGSLGSFPPGSLSLDRDQILNRTQKLKRVLSSKVGEMTLSDSSSPDSSAEVKFDDGRFKPVRRLSSYNNNTGSNDKTNEGDEEGTGTDDPEQHLSSGSTSPKPKVVSNYDLDLALDCILSVDTVEEDNDSEDDNDGDENAGEKGGKSRASVVAFELFKNACDVMDSEEFSVWYERHVSKLFEPSISRKIKNCLDRSDPRLSPDFLFPESASFIPDRLIAHGLFRGTYSKGWELLKGSPELTELVGYETAGNIFFYESILESKVLDLFSHLVYKKKVAEGSIRPLDYYFQTIAVLPSGKRMIVRVHCWWFANSQETCDTEETGNAMHVRMQDVSCLYPTILLLPPLPY